MAHNPVRYLDPIQECMPWWVKALGSPELHCAYRGPIHLPVSRSIYKWWTVDHISSGSCSSNIIGASMLVSQCAGDHGPWKTLDVLHLASEVLVNVRTCQQEHKVMTRAFGKGRRGSRVFCDPQGAAGKSAEGGSVFLCHPPWDSSCSLRVTPGVGHNPAPT